MASQCPECQTDLKWLAPQTYICENSGQQYKKIAHCSKCGGELESLNACGSASYFCNGECNELKSKSSAVISFEKSA